MTKSSTTSNSTTQMTHRPLGDSEGPHESMQTLDVCGWQPEDNIVGSSFRLHAVLRVDLGSSGLCDKVLYPLSNLTLPNFFFFFKYLSFESSTFLYRSSPHLLIPQIFR